MHISPRVPTNERQTAIPHNGTKLIPPSASVDLKITLEPVEKAIADGVFCSRILKDQDQFSFLGISLAVCLFGRVSPL